MNKYAYCIQHYYVAPSCDTDLTKVKLMYNNMYVMEVPKVPGLTKWRPVNT